MLHKSLRVLPLVAVLGAMAAFPAVSGAAHENTCANAIASGDYTLVTGSGTIVGTDGNDVIVGSAGADTISGGNGDDVICGRGGADTLDGGNGVDLVLGDVCTGCAGENGAPGDDVVLGGNGNDTLWGDEGADTVSGENGDDRVIGGNPGGDGDEIDGCDGGRGTDTAVRCDAATTTNVP